MDVFLALLAAVAFAAGSVLQQKGTLTTSDGDGHPTFLAQIVREPVWLAGAVLQGVGWVLQAIALDTGPLVVVQSITTLSLVFALPLGARLTGQVITSRVVAGAATVVVGIVLFLSVGSPKGGTANPAASEWWSACLTTLVLVVGIGLSGRRTTGAPRALLFGVAAGFGFGLQTAVTKQFVTVVGHGLGAVFASWTIYVLIISAISGFVLQQSALKTGVLAPALASSNAVTLFAGVVLGITVFGETLARGDGRLVPAVLGLAAALAGVIILAGSPQPQPADT